MCTELLVGSLLHPPCLQPEPEHTLALAEDKAGEIKAKNTGE
jgi:hypothetical protein